MKVTSVNLHGFESWNEREPNILAYLRKQDADIVLFQEAVFLPEVSPYNQIQLLNQSLQYMSEHTAITRLQVGRDYPVWREGLGILSKYPILKTDTVSLTKAADDEHQRIIQLVDVQIDELVVKIANVHFSITDFSDLATPHLIETLNILKSRGEKRIIAGDFNLTYLEDSAELWQEDYIASTDVPYITYVPMNKRVDYFLIPRDYQFDSITVSDDSLSDHRALTIEISDALLPQDSVESTSRTRSLSSHE